RMARTRKAAAEKKEDWSDSDGEATLDGVTEDKRELPPKNVESMRRKLLIGRVSSLSSGASLFSIRHPRLGTAALFQLSATSCDEVLLLEDEYRTLFHGDTVIADGRPRLLSPFNPLFLVLPYLEKKKARYETLEEILRDDECPAIERLAGNEQAMRELERVADVTDACDEKLYKLNEKKALEWIRGRFEILKNALVANAKLHDSITTNEEVLDRYTFGVLSDHLSAATPGNLAAAAKELLQIKDAPKAEAAPEPLGMKRKMDDDENLYGCEMPPAKKTPTQTATQKKLQQASKGTKSLASFFGKKTN
ncbi:hypothetical protein PFISCL1PPCAC_16928, partial [Pristionchus fissidentatus]